MTLDQLLIDELCKIYNRDYVRQTILELKEIHGKHATVHEILDFFILKALER